MGTPPPAPRRRAPTLQVCTRPTERRTRSDNDEPAERALACHSARSASSARNLHPSGVSGASDAPFPLWVRGGTAPRQPLPGTHGVWPQDKLLAHLCDRSEPAPADGSETLFEHRPKRRASAGSPASASEAGTMLPSPNSRLRSPDDEPLSPTPGSGPLDVKIEPVPVAVSAGRSPSGRRLARAVC